MPRTDPIRPTPTQPTRSASPEDAPRREPDVTAPSPGTVPAHAIEVLLPLDGSELGHRAFPHVAKLLDPTRHHLTLLRVGDGAEPAPSALARPMVLPGWPGPMPTEAELDLMKHPIYDSQLWESFRNELADDMSDEVAALRDAGFDVTLEVRTGDAVEEILGAAEDDGCDLIVMTTHGRSGLSKALMGSVTEGVLRRAEIPVLILRPHEA